jgi:hypothetical protein
MDQVEGAFGHRVAGGIVPDDADIARHGIEEPGVDIGGRHLPGGEPGRQVPRHRSGSGPELQAVAVVR